MCAQGRKMRIRCQLPDGHRVVLELDGNGASLSELLRALGSRLEMEVQSGNQLHQLHHHWQLHHHNERRQAGQPPWRSLPPPLPLGAAATNSSASASADAATSGGPQRPPSPQPPQPPLLVADVLNGELCPSLHQLYSAHRPQSQFDRLLLAIHCLMVESGFAAVEDEAGEQPETPDYSLPASVAGQLGGRGGASVSVAYAYRLAPSLDAAPESGHIRTLLKVVNTGRLAICHCSVAQRPEPPVLCASAHYNIERFIGRDRAGNVSFVSFRLLSVQFKDYIAQRAKAAIHEACGLPPLGLPGLPTELLLLVMRHCDFASVCRLGQTCSRMSRLYTDNWVWRSQMSRQFSGSDRYEQVRTEERQGGEVNYYEEFVGLHEERVQRRRMIARLSSRELSLPLLDILPGVLPPVGFLRSSRGGRFSLDILPEHPEHPLNSLFRDMDESDHTQ